MSEKERLVTFTLLGQDYAFYTGASEEEMERILGLVRKLVEDKNSDARSGTIPVSKTAVLACLNIASRYIKLKQDFEEYKKENDLRACTLINQIDARLQGEKRGKGV